MDETMQFALDPKKSIILNDLLARGKRDAPPFFEQGVCEDIYIPVEGGEIHVYHHKPDKIAAKRPIVFLPGFISNPITWPEFHATHHSLAEYFYLETREKASSRIKKEKDANFTVEQCAKDLTEAIRYLGLQNKDYYLHGSSFGAAVTLYAMAKGFLDPPTVGVYDPMIEWVFKNRFVLMLMKVLSPGMINLLKRQTIGIITLKEKNKTQKKRMKSFVETCDGWKVKLTMLQNKDFDMRAELKKIKKEVYVFTSPLDHYHPTSKCYEYAKLLPNGRFFYMATDPANRSLLAGVVATLFAFKSKSESLPEELLPFEIKLTDSAFSSI
ncbi:MAG: hypothetical protein ACTSYD_07605 [Candidatus Heimdallarchaeaceae archaeon]